MKMIFLNLLDSVVAGTSTFIFFNLFLAKNNQNFHILLFFSYLPVPLQSTLGLHQY